MGDSLLEAKRALLNTRTFKHCGAKELNVRKPRIVPVGPPGSGKSAWLNTFLSALIGRYSNLVTHRQSSSHVTLKTKEFGLDAFGGPNVSLLDLFGLQSVPAEMLTAFIHRSLPSEMEMRVGQVVRLEDFPETSSFSAAQHMFVFFVHGQNYSHEIYKTVYKPLMSQLETYEVPFVVVVTMVDLLAPEVMENPATARSNPKVSDALTKVADQLGVNAGCVHPWISYNSSYEMNTGVNKLALNCIEAIFNDLDDYFISLNAGYKKHPILDKQKRLKEL